MARLKEAMQRSLDESAFRRFWGKVLIGDGCWLWTDNPNSDGYGHIYRDGRNQKAHRVAYEMTVGEIPSGRLIDHICRVRLCVNPGHLRLATRAENGQNRNLSKNNTTGLRGVSFNKAYATWSASVFHAGKRYFLGNFPTPEQAGRAALAKRNELYTHNDSDKE